MNQLCQGCEKTQATVVDPQDNSDYPYLVCAGCHERLRERALRPLEWFNLSKRHGWNSHCLHDDFYDEDGTASQPEIDVPDPESASIPTLTEARRSVESLLDYTITRWSFTSELSDAWAAFPKDAVLRSLESRYNQFVHHEIRANTLTIARTTLKEMAAEFVRRAWDAYPESTNLWSLAHASAACLPAEEGYKRVLEAIEALPKKEQRDDIRALCLFQSSASLDWLEANYFGPCTYGWGELAAASALDWPRAEQWLTSGRPLSLVALDALGVVAGNGSPLMNNLRIELLNPPREADLVSVLNAYRASDQVPRVTQSVDFLLNNLSSLVARG